MIPPVIVGLTNVPFVNVPPVIVGLTNVPFVNVPPVMLTELHVKSRNLCGVIAWVLLSASAVRFCA